MSAIWNWAKEHYDLLSFLLGIVGVYISVLSLMYELRKRKKENMSQRKSRLVKASRAHRRNGGIEDGPVAEGKDPMQAV